jgi:hypothetical protein
MICADRPYCVDSTPIICGVKFSSARADGALEERIRSYALKEPKVRHLI